MVTLWVGREKAKDEQWPQSGGLNHTNCAGRIYVAGTGIVVTFSSPQADRGRVGIPTIEEGRMVDGKWTAGRVMNGIKAIRDDTSVSPLEILEFKN